MSEFFAGITFPQQRVTPSDDAAVRRAMLADGILSGCELSYSGYSLTMSAGLMIACGREFRHTSVQNWAVTGATSGFARLLLTIDTTKASIKDTFAQILDSIEYATAQDGFPNLQQTDINQSGTIYQLPVCVVSLGAGGITGIVSAIGETAAAAYSDVKRLSETSAELDANGKLKAEQASATVKVVVNKTSYTLTADDMGKLLILQNNSGGTTDVTIPEDLAMERFPLGSEIEISKWNGGLAVNISVQGSVKIRTKTQNTLTTVSIDGNYGIIAFKRIASTIWYVTGDIA